VHLLWFCVLSVSQCVWFAKDYKPVKSGAKKSSETSN
jgi:hypothetical protein